MMRLRHVSVGALSFVRERREADIFLPFILYFAQNPVPLSLIC